MLCVLQDFEIAGSRTGALSAECATGEGCECDSPLGTVNSWDSHSHYRRMASPDLSLYSGVILYCDYAHLKTPIGFLRVLFLVTLYFCLWTRETLSRFAGDNHNMSDMFVYVRDCKSRPVHASACRPNSTYDVCYSSEPFRYLSAAVS